MDRRLLTVGLGTFHALLVFVALLLLLHSQDGLQTLLALGTAGGIAVFVVFTGATIGFTACALRGVARGRHPFGQAALWGGLEGCSALLASSLGIALDGQPQVLLFSVFGLPFAFGVGAVVGFVLAILDMVLVDAGSLGPATEAPADPAPGQRNA